MSGLLIQDVSKSYTEGSSTVQALKKANLEVKPGELVAINGPSGSGKSTLLSIAGALLSPTEGKVMINGQDISLLSEKKLAQFRLNEIGFILQTSNLVSYLKVIDQLLLVKRMGGKVTSDDKKFAKKLLTDLGLGDKFNKMPNELSGGERQRVAIARAFMNNSNVILADEPTASLDSKRAIEVVKLIAKEAKEHGVAAVMVTHDERMLPLCDRVYNMQDGVLTEQV